jgi:hypothetical protein
MRGIPRACGSQGLCIDYVRKRSQDPSRRKGEELPDIIPSSGLLWLVTPVMVYGQMAVVRYVLICRKALDMYTYVHHLDVALWDRKGQTGTKYRKRVEEMPALVGLYKSLSFKFQVRRWKELDGSLPMTFKPHMTRNKATRRRKTLGVIQEQAHRRQDRSHFQ